MIDLATMFDDLRTGVDSGQRAYRKAKMARWRAQERARLNAMRSLAVPEESDEPTELPRREQVAPVVAWRFARVVQEHDGWRFASLNYSNGFGTFTVEDEAVCKMRGKHKAPALDCTCGFYALNRKPPLSERVAAREWLLEVELYGTVIAHRLGYRAQYQRVRSLLAGFCWCEEPASVVVAAREDYGFPRMELYCTEHHPRPTPLLGFARMLGTTTQTLAAPIETTLP